MTPETVGSPGQDRITDSAASELATECSACAGDECADLTCPKSLRPCGHHCNCVMVHDHCHFCDEEWGATAAGVPPEDRATAAEVLAEVEAGQWRDGQPDTAALTACPTHAVCPPCREGWGHWNGHEHVPTIQSEAAKNAVYVSHECYGDRHDGCAWPRCECGCHRGR